MPTLPEQPDDADSPEGSSGAAAASVSEVITPPAATNFPAWTYSVAAFRARLRRDIFDPADIPDPADSTLTLDPVLPDDALDDALRAALSVLSVYRPQEKTFALTLTAGQAEYALPVDFFSPVKETWPGILGGQKWRAGRYYGSRYARLREDDVLNAPARPWQGVAAGVLGTTFGLLPTLSTDGLIVAARLFSGIAQATFLDADALHPVPRLLLDPAPTNDSPPFPALRYHAALGVYRLDPNGDIADTEGTTYAWLYDGQELDALTDVLSVSAGSDNVRLLLLYAKSWVLREKVLAAADSDQDTYAFYSTRTTQGRGDIADEADRALNEFRQRTALRPIGRVRKL